MNTCNVKFSDFIEVRRTTCLDQWFTANDDLFGTWESYGIYGTSCNWNINFSQLDYDEILITTIDMLVWLVSERTVIEALSAPGNTISSDERQFDVISSSLNLLEASKVS
jgi:hypothetical protein